MKPLAPEFAPRQQPAAWLVWTLSAVLALFTVDQGMAAWRERQQALKLQQRSDELAAKLTQLERERSQAAALARIEPPYAADLAAVTRMASFPSGRILLLLERSLVSNLRVTKLDMSAVERTANVEVEFTDDEALPKFLDLLNAGEDPPRWQIQRVQAGSRSTAAPSTAVVVSRWP